LELEIWILFVIWYLVLVILYYLVTITLAVI